MCFGNKRTSYRGFTYRALVVGILLTAFLAIVIPVGDKLIRGTRLGTCHLPIGVVCIFVFLVAILNIICKKMKVGFSKSELIFIYCLMLAGAGIPSFDQAYLIPSLAAPRYYATPENEWGTLFFQYIPRWLAPIDAKAAKYFHDGLPKGMPIPWGLWVKPLFFWTIFAISLHLITIGFCVILRKQWVQRERLLFPLVQLPMEMLAEDKTSALPIFFNNRLMWLGFSIPALIHIINGLHFHFPAFPQIPLFYDLGEYFTQKPFNALRPFWAIIHFSVIGVSYLLPKHLSFSLWFFYLFYLSQLVIRQLFGYPSGTPFIGHIIKSFAAYQMAGALVALFFLMLLRARLHLWDVVKKAFTKKDVDDSLEPLSYRGALFSIFFGIIVICWFGTMAGVPGLIILSIIILFFITLVSMTRMVCEGGVLFIHLSFRPLDLIVPFTGTAAIGPRALTVLSFVEISYLTDMRSSLMPSMLNAFKLSDSGNLKHRPLLFGMIGSILVATIISYLSILTIGYRHGSANLGGDFIWPGRMAFFRLTSMLVHPRSPNASAVFSMITGGVFMCVFSFMHQRFFWWPFHPLGYAMAPTWPMIQLWFPTMLGWLFKTLTLRYGGLRFYRLMRIFFLGLILGEFLSGGLWLIVDVITNTRGHRLFLHG